MVRILKTVLVASTIAAALTACAKPADTASDAGSGAGSPTTRSISQAPPPTPATATPAPSATANRSPVPVTTPSPPAKGTGIAGVTTIDGGCPVIRAEPPCPDRPVTARLSVLGANGAVVTTVDSDKNGHFTVALPPGSYVLRPQTIAGAPPHAPQGATVTVKPGQYTIVTLRFDSGIR